MWELPIFIFPCFELFIVHASVFLILGIYCNLLLQYMWFYLDLSFLQTSYYTVMGEFLFHAYSNLGDYLSISLSSFIKKGLYKMKNHGMDLKQVNHPTEYSQWQNIPVDMMESIVKQIKATDRIRLSCVCKSWRQMLVLYKDIWITAPDIPWLLLPHSGDEKAWVSIACPKVEFIIWSGLSRLSEGGFAGIQTDG